MMTVVVTGPVILSVGADAAGYRLDLVAANRNRRPPDMPAPQHRICPVCGESFPVTRHVGRPRVTCSLEHAAAWRRFQAARAAAARYVTLAQLGPLGA